MQQKFEHGGNLYKAMRGAMTCSQIIDYSANINPLGLSEKVREAISTNIDKIIHYPDTEAYDLKLALSNYYGLSVNSIVAGNGAVELMYVLCHVMRPKKVVIPAPAFSEYERASLAVGAEITYFMLNETEGFKLDLNKLAAHIKGADIVFIGNPNNPTGTIIENTELKDFIKYAKNLGVLVVVDESFLDFLADHRRYTCRAFISEFDNLVIMHSLTKFFAIPGLRLGFAAANEKLAALLHTAKDPWNVNTLAQFAGTAALGDSEYIEKSIKLMADTKIEFYDMIEKVDGLTPLVPSVNFMLINTQKTGITGPELRKRMYCQGILIRDCSGYPGLSPYYIRVAIKKPETNAVVARILEKVVGD